MYPDYLFKIFGVGIDMYSILLGVGVIACLVFIRLAMKKEKYSRTASDTIIFVGIFATAIGIFFAVLFQSFYDFIKEPSDGFKLTGRMTFFGGLIGGVGSYILLYVLFVKIINPRLKDTNILKADMNKGIFELLKFVPIGITIAHAFGRFGCFFAGCCYGVETDAWFGIKFETTTTKVVPTQLFEAIFLIVLTAVMMVLYFKFDFKYNLGLYGIAYGIWRFVIEFFRGDDRGGTIMGLSPSQFTSILLFIGGIAFIIIYRYLNIKREKQNKEINEAK